MAIEVREGPGPILVDLNELLHVDNWKPHEAHKIYRLECQGWAPWLRFSRHSIARMSEVFPVGQIVVRNGMGIPIGYMSANRINWDGRRESLGPWDGVAGDSVKDASYEKTFTQGGNTLVMMSTAIDEQYRGKRISSMLVDGMKNLAEELNVKHLIGPFRPTGYGRYKLEYGDPGFENYCNLLRPDGLPIDTWLRNMTRNRMVSLKVESHAMMVRATREAFERYRATYHPDLWREIRTGIWECGEVGKWFVYNHEAIYVESNIWGEVPFNELSQAVIVTNSVDKIDFSLSQ